MISPISSLTNSPIEERTHGKMIYQLSLLSVPNDYYRIETSYVIDRAAFLSYKRASILPEGLVERIVEQLNKLQIVEADFYSNPEEFYSEYYPFDIELFTIRVTNTNVRNTITTIYNRWFDGSSYATRRIFHKEEYDTYPVILIQPHCREELSVVTRHPDTGRLLRGNDAIGLRQCSKRVLNELDEEAIAFMDRLCNKPLEIKYYRDNENNKIIIRRVNTYTLSSEAKILYVLSKCESANNVADDLLCFIWPGDVYNACSTRFKLTANVQYQAKQTTLSSPNYSAVKGKAVFPWSNPETVDAPSIFLATDTDYDSIRVLEKCCGAVFANRTWSNGGDIWHRGHVCNALRIMGIDGASNLVIDCDAKRAFAKRDDIASNQAEYQEIKEGDTICIVGRKWSLGGDIIPIEQPLKMREILGNLLKPYTDKHKLKTLSPEKQQHFSQLIQTLKETGWNI